MPVTTEKAESIRATIAYHVNALKRHFTGDIRLTLILRSEDDDSAALIMSDEDDERTALEAARKLLLKDDKDMVFLDKDR